MLGSHNGTVYVNGRATEQRLLPGGERPAHHEQAQGRCFHTVHLGLRLHEGLVHGILTVLKPVVAHLPGKEMEHGKRRSIRLERNQLDSFGGNIRTI